MQADRASADKTKPITIVSTISKSSGRFVIGIPSKFKDTAEANFAKPVRVVIEPLL